MKKDLIVFVFITIAILVVYHLTFFNFFAQDDFILINHFSQNSIRQNISNVFGYPTVTHWRPFHNLYFLVAGNTFGKNYFGYHILTFAFHIGSTFSVYKIAKMLFKNQFSAFAAGIVYGIHPAHFVSLFWISGGATIIGFFFLTSSFYSYLLGRKKVSLILLLAAFLSSEAMIVGILIFFAYRLLLGGDKKDSKFLKLIIITSGIFLIVRLILTSKAAFTIYHPEFSSKTFLATKYYLLRILGFAEASGDQLISIILLASLGLVVIFLLRYLMSKKQVNLLLFSLLIMFVGLFPFILIPQHLSPHYMNISIWGFSILVSLALTKVNLKVALIIIFAAISIYVNQLTANNNWVTKRSNLARIYLQKIDALNLPAGTKLIFNDNPVSTSEEAYISLGTGEAVKFWFYGKNYETCFTFIKKCAEDGQNFYVINI